MRGLNELSGKLTINNIPNDIVLWAAEEMIRITPEGKIYVRGELTEDNKEVSNALIDWFKLGRQEVEDLKIKVLTLETELQHKIETKSW